MRHWGGGFVVSADGLRFVVPVKSLWAAPNPRYFGHRRGGTWLNVVNDQVMGIGGLVVPGTVRDLLYILDAILNRDGVLARDVPLCWQCASEPIGPFTRVGDPQLTRWR